MVESIGFAADEHGNEVRLWPCAECGEATHMYVCWRCHEAKMKEDS